MIEKLKSGHHKPIHLEKLQAYQSTKKIKYDCQEKESQNI
jgi:hypothetical protein